MNEKQFWWLVLFIFISDRTVDWPIISLVLNILILLAVGSLEFLDWLKRKRKTK